MENFNWLLQGFAEAATPMNLLYAVIDPRVKASQI